MTEPVHTDAEPVWTKDSARQTVKAWLNEAVKPKVKDLHWLQKETGLDFSKLYNWFSHAFRKTPPSAALEAIIEAVGVVPPERIFEATAFLFPRDPSSLPDPLTGEIVHRPLASLDEVGRWIVYARKHRSKGWLTQSELAGLLGCTAVQVHKWESPRSPLTPSPDELQRIAEICGFPAPEVDLTSGESSALDPMAAEIVNRPLASALDVSQWIVHVRKHGRGGKLSQFELAERIERSPMSIHKWEKPGSHMCPAYDDLQRIAHACGFPVPEIAFELRPSRDGRPQLYMPPLASTLSEEIHHTAKALASRCFKGEMADRNAGMFAQRFGCNGQENATLQAIGDTFGVTRERVRMIEERLLEFRQTTSVRSEMFEALSAAIEDLPTTTLSDAEARLRHLLGEGLSLEGALEYGTVILDRRLPLEITRRSGLEPLVHVGSLPEWYGTALNQCKTIIRHNGAALATVAWAMTMRTAGVLVPYQDFLNILERLPGFQWLGEHEWFWLGPDGSANRVVERAIAILQNSQGSVDIEDIYGGIVRAGRFDRSAAAEVCASWPPVSVVGRLLDEHPAFACKQFNDFSLKEPQPRGEAEDQAAADAIVAYLASQGGVASRWQINEHITNTGLFQKVTVGLALATSPMIAQVDRGVFAIRGWPLSSDRLEQAQASVGGPMFSRPVQVEDGRVSWENVLTDGSVRNHATALPARAKDAVPEGRYRVGDDHHLTVIEDRIGGLVSHLLRIGAQPGWLYRISFDVPSECATVDAWPPEEMVPA